MIDSFILWSRELLLVCFLVKQYCAGNKRQWADKESAGWTEDNVKAYAGPTPELVAGIAKHVRGTLKSTYTICESGTAGPTQSGKTPNRQP